MNAVKFYNPYSLTVVTGNKLPHWQQESAVFFVTFRLYDSIPVGLMRQLETEREAWVRHHPEPWTEAVDLEYHVKFTRPIERSLDESRGQCFLRNPDCARIVGDTLAHFEGERCHQLAWVVMPNHVHVLFMPRPPWSLGKLLHSWKSFSAHALNRKLGRDGPVWQKNYFDRMVRDEAHLHNLVRYIRRNPVKAKLRVGEYLHWEGDLGRAID